MDWRRIIDAANGRPQSLAWFVRRGTDADVAALATLLLLEEAPHAAAALVAAARSPDEIAPPVRAALAPPVRAALAAWSADPHWANRAIGDRALLGLPWGVADMSGALRNDPAALRDAIAIVLHMGSVESVAHCLNALGAAGWAALDEDRRDALLARADPADLGRVWGALDGAQRAAATQRAESSADAAARLIGRIGADAWTATDRALRRRLIDAAARDPESVGETAPAWTGMTADERERLITAVMAPGASGLAATLLLYRLGAARRAVLTAAQRAGIEARAPKVDAWRVLAWRAADAGWGALTDEERRVVFADAQRNAARASVLIRDVGVAGWRAMTADERSRLAAAVRLAPDALFACPPALWGHLAGDALPPATNSSARALVYWSAEDGDDDLGGLPPSHQALVLALAPWRPEDAAKDSVRMQRLRAAWNQTPADERVALATGRPLVLPTVAAAARLGGGSGAVLDAVGATVARVVTMTGESDVKRDIGAMLRGTGAWRAWMAVFAPSDGDPSDAWAAWRDAARRGSVPDPALCARLAARRAACRRAPARAAVGNGLRAPRGARCHERDGDGHPRAPARAPGGKGTETPRPRARMSPVVRSAAMHALLPRTVMRRGG